MEFTLIIWLLPIVFMLHDFEEIIMMDAWMKKNRQLIIERFPKLGKRIVSNYGNLSTASFSLAVAIEFLILVIAVILATQFQSYLIWTACFIAFSIHLIVHVVQWLVIRIYIPAIISSFLALVYSCFGFKYLIGCNIYSNSEIIWIGIGGLLFMIINLIFAHKMAAKFEKFLLKFEKGRLY